MCFLIAGVQPKTKTVDPSPRRCPQCGLHQAEVRQVDHYVSLFFIPLLRVKQGEPFLYCRRCERMTLDERERYNGTGTSKAPDMCGRCGRTLEKGYNYCPNCGEPRQR